MCHSVAGWPLAGREDTRKPVRWWPKAAVAALFTDPERRNLMQAEIKGSTMPILEVTLQQGEHVVTPHGELAWMTTSIQMSQTTNTGGGAGGLMGGLKRVMGGGGLFLTRYDGPGSITFAAKVPGHIVPVDISGGHSYLVHRHGWMCGTAGITPSVALQQSFRGGLYGGEGVRAAEARRAGARLGRAERRGHVL
jgi:uncharacterized protein (AIM24 family)